MFRGLLKSVLKVVFKTIYRVRVEGLEKNFKHDRLLIIANHESWLDGLLLGLFLPVNPVFVVYTGILGRPFFRIALSIVDYLTVDTTNPMAIKKVVELLKSGRPVVIFPEGRLTTTGWLMKVYEGPAFAAVKSDATIIPVNLDGPGRSLFTRLEGNNPRHRFPQITISIQEATRIEVPDGLSAKQRRKLAGVKMRKIMETMAFNAAKKHTIYNTFVNSVQTFGEDREILADLYQLKDETKTMKDYTYGQILQKVIGSAVGISKFTKKDDAVGILLPNMAGTLSLMMGISAKSRIPAMLNYKAGPTGLQDACTAAAIKTVITSHLFIEKEKMQAEVEAMEKIGVKVYYSEDIRGTLSVMDKAKVYFGTKFPRTVEEDTNPERAGVILFTSGSESKPKGVVLSHRALMSNICQVRSVFDFSADDRVLNAMPIFHSFGLTGGSFLPLLSGMHLVLYVSPLHYRIVPEVAYDRNSTVLFGTNTFLANYGKHANEYDFFRLRYVVAGAEKLTDTVRNMWFEKFGKRIFEGYGATETAPVLAVNTPKAYRTGTVGQFLPGIEYKLLPVPGIDNGGALYVKGPNVMTGYYRYENPGVLEPTHSEIGEGWYETGDVVSVEDDFVTIRDRIKRFAKIGGEMVSLTQVEKIAITASPTGMHASTTQPNESKGETIVLYTTDPNLIREHLTKAAQECKFSDLSVPRKIVVVPALPLLGTGKTDYVTLKKMAATA